MMRGFPLLTLGKWAHQFGVGHGSGNPVMRTIASGGPCYHDRASGTHSLHMRLCGTDKLQGQQNLAHAM